MWAEMAAPMLIGTKLVSASSTTLSILGNTDVIAIDQDSLGKQGVQISSKSGLRVLAKPLSNGDVAVALFNESGSTATISTTASAIGIASASSYQLTDLWSKKVTTTTSKISASVPSHGTVLFRVHA
jgi:alpha-galactosidase